MKYQNSSLNQPLNCILTTCCVIALAFLSTNVNAYAQGNDGMDNIAVVEFPAVEPVRIPWWIGPDIGFGPTFHSTNGTLRCLGDPGCPTYSSGRGSLFSIGAIAEYRFGRSFGLAGRLTYAGGSVKMTTSDDRARTRDAAGNVVPLVREHSMEAALPAVQFDLLADYNVWENIHLFGGPSFGLLTGPTWSSSAVLVSPGNVVFGSLRRDTTFLEDQAIPSASSLQVGLTFGASYRIALSNKFALNPRVAYTMPLTPILSNEAWKQSSLIFGVQALFGVGVVKPEVNQRRDVHDSVTIQDPTVIGNQFRPGTAIRKTEVSENEAVRIITELTVQTDTLVVGAEPPKPPPAKRSPSPALRLVSLDASSQEQVSEIVVSGQFVSEGFPILPIVFFDAASGDLAGRYRRLTNLSSFRPNDLEPSPLVQHRDILNIIGKRMQENPKTRITLTGTVDPETEKGQCDLAELRAQNVKRYLTETWEIADDRIRIRKGGRGCAPESPTYTKTDQGYAENRRVEIDSDDDEVLLAPLVQEKYIEVTGVKPKSLEMRMSPNAERPIAKWTSAVSYNEKSMSAANGFGQPKAVAFTIGNEQARTFATGELAVLELKGSVEDNEGLSGDASLDIPVRRDTSFMSIERLSLMHFQVLQDRLNRAAKAAIKRFVSDLDKNSSVSIVGYTDNLGDESLNKELSEKRAKSVTDFIVKTAEGVQITNSEGVGSSKYPPGISSHELPEARFLSRTVQIEIHRSWR